MILKTKLLAWISYGAGMLAGLSLAQNVPALPWLRGPWDLVISVIVGYGIGVACRRMRETS